MDSASAQAPRISRDQYEAVRARENAACAAFAYKWGVEAVGRDYPLHLSRAGPAVAGEWYVIRNGERCKATAAQARDLDRVCRYGVHAVGPVYAATASNNPTVTVPG